MSNYKRAPLLYMTVNESPKVFLKVEPWWGYVGPKYAGDDGVPYVPLSAVEDALNYNSLQMGFYNMRSGVMDYLRNQRWLEPPKPEPRQAMYGDKIRWRGPHGPTKLRIYGRDGREYWCDRNGEFDDEITRPLEYEVYNPTTDTWHPCSGLEGGDDDAK